MRPITLALSLIMVVALSACGAAQVRGTALSGEKNIWIADPSNGDVSFCLSHGEGIGADPVCYPARYATHQEIQSSHRLVSAPSAAEESAPSNKAKSDK